MQSLSYAKTVLHGCGLLCGVEHHAVVISTHRTYFEGTWFESLPAESSDKYIFSNFPIKVSA